MTAPDKPSDVEQAVANLEIAAGALEAVPQESPLARQFTNTLAAEIRTLLVSHERLRLEVERLRGYMTPGQIEDSEHMKEIVPRMLKAEAEVARLLEEVAAQKFGRAKALGQFERMLCERDTEVERLTRERAAERDKEWREAADHAFDGIRPNAELIELYTSERDLPTAIIHEIWKRDPRVQQAVAEERKALREIVHSPIPEVLPSAQAAKARRLLATIGTPGSVWGAGVEWEKSRIGRALDAREKEGR